jgi:serine/threonine protein kinase
MPTPVASDRARKVEEIYRAALDREPDARIAFIDRSCGGDDGLRTQVESLLAANANPLSGASTATIVQPGSRLGRYAVERAIGAGGMGEVFLARDTLLHRAVAIKILSRHKLTEERRRRLLQEARAVSALNHPNIITLHDIATEGDTDYLVMEYVPGHPLSRLIPPEGLPPEQAVAYAVQAAGALAAAHGAGIVHRDIKPANLMVTPEGQVKVLDFGLARIDENAARAASPSATVGLTLTQPGEVMGTVPYMSPEQVQGQESGAAYCMGHKEVPVTQLRKQMLEELQRRNYSHGLVRFLVRRLDAQYLAV